MKREFKVEMFDTNANVTTEEWSFETLEEAKDFFEKCKADYMEPADKEHMEWLLGYNDENGDYVEIESYKYQNQ